MSNKERAIQLLENVPDNKLVFIVNILESLIAYANEEIEPDDWDLEMIKIAEKENNGATYTTEEILKECELTYADIYD